MMPPSGLSGTSRSEAGSTRRKVARSPNDSSSRGTGACRAGTGLGEAAITTKRSAPPAPIFARVWAPPPPLINQPSGAIWSAPSMVMSNRSMLVTSSIRSPSSRAACSVRGDVAAQTMDRDRLARAGEQVARGRAGAEPDGHAVLHQLRGRFRCDLLLALNAHDRAPPDGG